MSDPCDFVNAETIKDSPLGVELSLQQCKQLVDMVLPICLGEGQFLLEEGAKDDALFVITKGTLEVVKSTGDNDWVTLQLLKTGDITGEMGFIDQRPHSAGVRALTNTEIYSLSREKLESFLQTDPEITYKVLRAIIRIVHKILSRMNLQYVEMNNYISKQHGRY